VWNAAGRPPRQAWYVDQGPRQAAAVNSAADLHGYTIFGLTPFLRNRQLTGLAVEPLVLSDPLLQRPMVSVVVNPETVGGVNAPGANALQDFLLAPATQARMREVRVPGIDQQIWWPPGRGNLASSLPH
jgi:ABC-type tungstate transport system permease subunit